MRYRLQKVFLLLALCTATLWAGAQNEVLFHQDFDALDGKGGNDQQWSGSLTTKPLLIPIFLVGLSKRRTKPRLV